MISSRLFVLVVASVQRHFHYLISSFYSVARYVLHNVATPFAHDWMRPANIKPVLFRIIQRLKPAYRDSYATYGLSLGTHP